MANKFALFLVLATLITGILWCGEKLLRRRRGASADAAGGETKKPGKPSGLASLFPVLALVLIIRSFIYEPFQIPSGSMMPTLLIGDFILVEKFAYGLKDPITQTTLIPTGHPQRGDIVVFKYPRDPALDYIKRVVGVPGDRITYDPQLKQVTVQAHCQAGQTCDAVPVVYSDVQPSEFVQTFNFGAQGGEAGSGFYALPLGETKDNGVRLAQRTETLAGVAHRVLAIPGVQDQSANWYQQPGQPVGSWVVPEGYYFMMGDNRDNSADSRYWGFVPEKNLVGKATLIWMSFEKQEGQWPTGLRLNRIGKIR